VGAWIVWIAVALAAWVTIAAVVAMVLGRAIRIRDRQVPTDDAAAAIHPSRMPAEDLSVPEPEHRRRPR
jgi:hypothetical protein